MKAIKGDEPVVLSNKATLSGLQLAHMDNVKEVVQWNVECLLVDLLTAMVDKVVRFDTHDLVLEMRIQPKMKIESSDEGD
jgi:hypothetical protein